ncbi:MAG: hypothetical protein ACI8R9_002295 [Paraglaciecola sp.]
MRAGKNIVAAKATAIDEKYRLNQGLIADMVVKINQI